MPIKHYFRAELGRGHLMLEYSTPRLKAYDGFDPTKKPRIKLYFETTRRKLIREIGQIASLAEKAGVSLADSIGRQPLQYAEILARYHDLGVVIRDSPRFDYLDSIVDAAKLPRTPRLEGNSLEFLTLFARLTEPEPKVRLIRWNIDSLEYSCENVPVGSALMQPQ